VCSSDLLMANKRRIRKYQKQKNNVGERKKEGIRQLNSTPPTIILRRGLATNRLLTSPEHASVISCRFLWFRSPDFACTILCFSLVHFCDARPV